MPTGYTCYIVDGQVNTLRDYALICARAFGACIELRDEKIVVGEVPNVGDSDSAYYKDQLQDVLLRLEQLENLTNEDLKEQAEEDFQAEFKSWEYRLAIHYAEQKRYSDMKAEVEKWQPPADYEELKNFMLNQIEISCDKDEYILRSKPVKRGPDQYRKDKKDNITYYIKYYTEELEKQTERNKERKNWIAGLVEALG